VPSRLTTCPSSTSTLTYNEAYHRHVKRYLYRHESYDQYNRNGHPVNLIADLEKRIFAFTAFVNLSSKYGQRNLHTPEG
jgi:hypothetical protein